LSAFFFPVKTTRVLDSCYFASRIWFRFRPERKQ
jgi:hypothetical protein